MANKRTAYLNPISTGNQPVEDEWLAAATDLVHHVGFAIRPKAVKCGDHLIYYAPGPQTTHQKMIAVARCSQDGEALNEGGGYSTPYRMPVQMLMAIPLLRFAPHYAVTGVTPGELKKADRVELHAHQYDAAIAAMTERLTLAPAK